MSRFTDQRCLSSTMRHRNETISGHVTFPPLCRIRKHTEAEALDASKFASSISSVELDVGVLHYTPGKEPFPLLLHPSEYVPDTIDIMEKSELRYWVEVLSGQIPTVVEKAIATAGGTDGTKYAKSS